MKLSFSSNKSYVSFKFCRKSRLLAETFCLITSSWQKEKYFFHLCTLGRLLSSVVLGLYISFHILYLPKKSWQQIIYGSKQRSTTEQRWKKYFSFCQLDVMRQKVSDKRRDFWQNLKDTTDLFEENDIFIFWV